MTDNVVELQQAFAMRHGEKRWENGKKPISVMGYDHDPPLARYDEIEAIIPRLEKLNITKVIASPFLRCRQTADYVSRRLGIQDYTTDNRLREYLGNWGNRPDRRVELDPRTYNLIHQDDQTIETFKIFLNRIESIIPMLKSGVLLITHNMVIRFLREEVMKKKVFSLGPADFIPINIDEKNIQIDEEPIDLSSQFLIIDHPDIKKPEPVTDRDIMKIIVRKDLQHYRVFKISDGSSVYKIIYEHFYRDNRDVFYNFIDNLLFNFDKKTVQLFSAVSKL
jgi:broad specificity phosphatase PhoE